MIRLSLVGYTTWIKKQSCLWITRVHFIVASVIPSNFQMYFGYLSSRLFMHPYFRAVVVWLKLHLRPTQSRFKYVFARRNWRNRQSFYVNLVLSWAHLRSCLPTSLNWSSCVSDNGLLTAALPKLEAYLFLSNLNHCRRNSRHPSASIF